MIPQYTAADLTRIPFVNADSINVLAMAKKIDTLEQRLNSLEQLLTQSLSQSHLSSSVNNEASTSCYEQGDQHTDAVNDARDIHVTDDGNDYSWNIVASRNCPVQQPRKVQPKNSSQAKRGENHTKKRKVFGTAHDDDKVIKSGVKIVRKAVLHVDNLDVGCTPQLLTDYLLSEDITVLSCYETKSWMREIEKDSVTAFRVCIPAEQRSTFTNPNLWSKDIILRDWKFKGKPTSQHGTQSSQHGSES